MVDGMNEEHLYSLIVYAGALGKELLMGSADTSAAKTISDSKTIESEAAETTTTTTTEITTTTSKRVPNNC